jgi:hypothetical protein
MAKNGKNAKLPKRIAGVKIPKHLRKSGGRVYSLLQTPVVGNVVADLLAAGLIAAADAMSKQPAVSKAGKTAKDVAADAGEATAKAATTSAISVGTVLAAAVREGARVISETYGSKR